MKEKIDYMDNQIQKLVLLTGASGYVGGRLLKILESENIPVRCLARKPEYLQPKVSESTEIYAGDVFDKDSLVKALKGVQTAYYMVHSMGSKKDFMDLDRQAAHNFGQAAQECGVERIIYLGGLGDSSEKLSSHLHSRHEVGNIFRQYKPVVIEFRASVVIGSGSLSFELIRALTERLPIMVTPRWVSVKAQPIAISDLMDYLVAGLEIKLDKNQIFEIGGADQVSYGDLMWKYAELRGLKRYKLSVPFLTPKLSSLWLGLVTPVYARVGRKLIDSLRHETIVKDQKAIDSFTIKPKGIRDSILVALDQEEKELAETRWSDAVSSSGVERNWGGVRFGNRLVDLRTESINVKPEIAFKPIQKIGGKTGWYYANWLWKIRGFFDLLVGGVGVRRGRPNPEEINIGDTIDWWRVEEFKPSHRLRLFAEMKLPGRAWLEFETEKNESGTTIKQMAIFDPIGLPGVLYWYLVYPLHSIIFEGMLKNIVKEAESVNPSD
jgi:uncharacterized protein YbjT (DUF2867 family)